MARPRVQVQETMAETDTDLSLLCDQLLEDREQTRVARADEHATESKLISLMKDKGKKSVKHGGKTFRVSHQEEKDKLQIVSE